MIEGYVLVEVLIGRAPEVARRFEEYDETVHADLVTGCYDVLARVRAATGDSLVEVVERMQTEEGVTRTLLCPVSHSHAAAHRGWQPLHAAV
jgi:hypothetical protein